MVEEGPSLLDLLGIFIHNGTVLHTVYSDILYSTSLNKYVKLAHQQTI